MCRMLGVVSASTQSFAFLLSGAPRSLAKLSKAHSDGWGIALGHRGVGWTTHRSLLRAVDDHEFHEFASQIHGDMMVAHVRQKTRGRVAAHNTHPFESGPWVFAHNGTVKDLEYLAARTSPERRARIQGETDSERLFAYLMTRIDEVHGSADCPRDRMDQALRKATRELEVVPHFGEASFLLSDGNTLYAHQLRAPLYLLQRPTLSERIEDLRDPSIAVASEPTTDDVWAPLHDGDLMRSARDSEPTWVMLR